MRVRDLAAPGLLVLGVGLLYGPSLGHGFVYDDHEVILAQRAPESWRALARVFVEPHGLPLSGLPYYRPLTRATLLLQKRWHGDAPTLFHAGNVALAGATALAAYAVLRHARFGLPPAFAALGAALFAVHPVASECVYPIASGRETLLAVLLALVAVALHLRGGIAGRLGATGAFALALLSKEQALVVPLLFVLADALHLTPDPPGRRVVAWLVRLAPALVVGAAYAGVRLAIFGPLGTEEAASVASHLRAHPRGPLDSLLYAVQTLFAPSLHVIYEPRELVIWISLPRLGVALTGALGLLTLVRRLPPGDRAPATFWALWIPIGMLTTLNLLPQEARFAERFLLLSLLGPAALVATGAARLATTGARRTAALVLGLGAVGLLAGVTALRARDWRDDLAFAQRWVATSPRHANARYSLGTALLRVDRVTEALPELREAVRLAPAHAGAWYNLGVALARQGRSWEAREALRRTLALDPASADAHYVLGALLARAGEPEAARVHLREAVRLRPGWAEPRRALER